VVRFTQVHRVAVAIARGDASAQRAFMTGDLRVGGDLGALLDAMPAAQRLAIVLTKMEGLSVAEAAERTGASVSALKVQVHRGLRRLAALVREQHENR